MRVRLTKEHRSTLFGRMDAGREVDVSSGVGNHWVERGVAEKVEGHDFDEKQDAARLEMELQELNAARRGRDVEAAYEVRDLENYLTEQRARQVAPEANVTPEEMKAAAEEADSDATDAESGAAGDKGPSSAKSSQEDSALEEDKPARRRRA